MRNFALTILILLSSSVCSIPALVPAPLGDKHVISLNGNWRFKIESAGDEARLGSEGDNDTRAEADRAKAGIAGAAATTPGVKPVESFQKLDYREDKTWVNLKVPGNWEMAGLSPATYNQPDSASGFYRLWFDVPKSWKGRLVRLNFDGVQDCAEVWLNVQLVKLDKPIRAPTHYQ